MGYLVGFYDDKRFLMRVELMDRFGKESTKLFYGPSARKVEDAVRVWVRENGAYISRGERHDLYERILFENLAPLTKLEVLFLNGGREI